MQRRDLDLLGERGAGVEQLPLRLPVPVGAEQAASGGGREGNAGQQLGIVAAAGAVQRLGPSVVEDVLALGVSLEIQGDAANHPLAFAQC